MTERRAKQRRHRLRGRRKCRRCGGSGVVGTGEWDTIMGGEVAEKVRPCECVAAQVNAVIKGLPSGPTMG